MPKKPSDQVDPTDVTPDVAPDEVADPPTTVVTRMRHRDSDQVIEVDEAAQPGLVASYRAQGWYVEGEQLDAPPAEVAVEPGEDAVALVHPESDQTIYVDPDQVAPYVSQGWAPPEGAVSAEEPASDELPADEPPTGDEPPADEPPAGGE